MVLFLTFLIKLGNTCNYITSSVSEDTRNNENRFIIEYNM